MLVEAGADVDALDVEGKSVLHFAARNGNVEMLRFLKAAGSWLHTPDQFGQTALHYAVNGGRAPAVQEILSWYGVDVNARRDGRVTPLHIAVGEGFLLIAELLVEAGADVNAAMEEQPGVEGTVLRVAAIGDRPEIIGLLLKAGAEVDPSGDVLMEAARRGCRGAVKVLLQARDWPEELRAAAMKLVRAGADL
jgi:ankyrin repeat protein